MSLLIRQAWRSMVHAPAVSATVVACVGLGVGASTTVFTWTDHLVRRPLPAVTAIDRVVSVVTRTQGREDGVSYADYLEWRDATTRLSTLAVFGVRQFGVTPAGGGHAATQPMWGLLVSDTYFPLLGIRPVAGRTFTVEDCRTDGEAPVAVISERAAARFGGAAAAVGQSLRINDVPFTIVGVAPADFVGTYAGLAFDLWVPVTMQPRLTGETGTLRARDIHWLQAIGRLRDGATTAEALAELRAVGGRVAGRPLDSAERDVLLKPLDTGAAQRLNALFAVLLGITLLIALIVCTNVANLLMLRGLSRAGEIGIRLSLGASRAQVFTQLLAESALLASAGGVAGVLLARWAQGLLPAFMPPSPLPLALDSGWDARPVVFATALALMMVLVFGIVAAIHTLRRAVLPTASRTSAGGTRAAVRLRGMLVVAQLALSMAALAAAGAFLRVNAGLAAVDRGLHGMDRVLVAAIDLDQAGYRTQEARIEVTDRLLSAIRVLPGNESAAVATFVPLGFTGYSSAPVSVPGYVPDRDEDMSVLLNRVSSGYFETAGIAILEGRPVEARDTLDAPGVAVVNEAFVRRYLAVASPVGHEISVGARRMRVIGVAANGKYRFDALDKPSPPFIYLAYAQLGRGSIMLHVRTRGRPEDAVAPIRRTVAAIDPALRLDSPTTLDEYTSLPLFPVQLGTAVLTWLGGVALLLSAAGLYGLLAYRVSQRRRELAVRITLGASGARLLREVIADGARQTMAGVVPGAVFGVLATRLIAARLRHIQAVDPTVLVGSAGVLVVVALFATLLPAIRASRVDPALALRAE